MSVIYWRCPQCDTPIEVHARCPHCDPRGPSLSDVPIVVLILLLPLVVTIGWLVFGP